MVIVFFIIKFIFEFPDSHGKIVKEGKGRRGGERKSKKPLSSF